MSLFDDKYNNQNNRKSMGDDLLDGIGSALPFAKEMSEKITGHTVEGDMKMLKGFSDAEYDEMDTKQLMKLKKTYFSRMISFPLAIFAFIMGAIENNFFLCIVGIVLLVISLKAIKQYKKVKKHLDVDK